MSEKEKPGKQNLNVVLSRDLKPEYCNVAMITHSGEDFIMDFIQALPMAQGEVKSRIIVTPGHAKRILKVLADNIQKFENANGIIADQEITPTWGQNAQA